MYVAVMIDMSDRQTDTETQIQREIPSLREE